MKTAPIPVHFFLLNDLKIVTERMQNTLLIFREIVKESMQMAHQQTKPPDLIATEATENLYNVHYFVV